MLRLHWELSRATRENEERNHSKKSKGSEARAGSGECLGCQVMRSSRPGRVRNQNYPVHRGMKDSGPGEKATGPTAVERWS